VKEPNNSIYSAASLALRVIFVRRKRPQIYALGMTILVVVVEYLYSTSRSASNALSASNAILGVRTEQHVVIGFGELAAAD